MSSATPDVREEVEKVVQRKVPNVRDAPVLVFVSDLHLGSPPLARTAESSWNEVQVRYLTQLLDRTMVRFPGDDKVRGGIRSWTPLVIGGDIWDKWKQPPGMINLIIQQFRRFHRVYAIPGQHDLPYHEYDSRHQSAYWTLVEAGVVHDLEPGYNVDLTDRNVALWAYPWGNLIKRPKPDDHKNWLRVCVAHRYVWKNAHRYEGAPNRQSVERMYDKLHGYDVALFGDNHMGWLDAETGCTIVNNGTFMRRKMDERHYKPRCHLVYADGRVEPSYFDVEDDKFLDLGAQGIVVADAAEAKKWMRSLEELADQGLNFEEAVVKMLDKERVSKAVRKLTLHCLGK